MSPLSDQLQKEERPLPKGLLFLLLPFGWMLCKLPDFIATLVYLWTSSLPWLGWFMIGLAVIVLLCWYTFAGLLLMLLTQQPTRSKVFVYFLFFFPLVALYLLKYVAVSEWVRSLADFALDILFITLPFAALFGILWFLRFHMKGASTG